MNIIPISEKNYNELDYELKKIGVCPAGIRVMRKKGKTLIFKIFNVPVTEANIIKQEMLSIGGEAAVHKSTITHKIKETDVLLFGNLSILTLFCNKLKEQNFRFLRELSENLLQILKDDVSYFLVGEKKYPLNQKYIMGIINITPDSFYSNSRKQTIKEVLTQAEIMIKEGADFLDIGAESTRPGAKKVSPDEEIERLKYILPELVKMSPIPISIDTYKSKVAEFAIDCGCKIVNDISGFEFDNNMLKTVLNKKATCILMHIQGTPVDMQKNPHYKDVILEVYNELKRKKNTAINAGIPKEKIILDVGIGFGKRLNDNYTLIKRLSEFKGLKQPILLGLSRKSLIGKVLNNEPENRLIGTVVLNTLGLIEGADILRVHDVKETKETIVLFEKYLDGYYYG